MADDQPAPPLVVDGKTFVPVMNLRWHRFINEPHLVLQQAYYCHETGVAKWFPVVTIIEPPPEEPA